MSIRNRYSAYRKRKGYSYAANLLVKGEFNFDFVIFDETPFSKGIREALDDFRKVANHFVEIGKARERGKSE